MNRTQISVIYDSMTPEQQDMPRAEFIKKAVAALDPTKLAAEADAIVQGRVQKAQIDTALRARG